ncbi:galactokinase [Haloplasma contractile]|uniref:Galactokinase n=1 Tax=Haloplasma contractile SSD-17B TaxID=1033810 RepID=U2FPY0_9MOLU|nr:galactokinase [Haloplasma contractile]ERJ13099.1 Galactokinase Carbohydrate transport protein [Haloplasma contractile SSD-17B]
MMDQLESRFKEVFNNLYEHIYFAPGRVNLIGEHTDYNGGNVFPCAIDIGTYLVIRKRKDRKLCFYSDNFSKLNIIELNLDDLEYNEDHNWANYPKGIFKMLKNQDMNTGFDLFYYGNIPNGAGLSSSASIEVVTALMLNDVFELKYDIIDLVKICQKTENEYIGVNCGIMDQFAIGMGKDDHAILLDTNTLKYDYAPLKLGKHKLVVTNTNKKRGLADSKYNERREECEQALSIIQEYIDVNTLGDLTAEQFESVKCHINDNLLVKRSRHAVYENIRTKKAKAALELGDLDVFGNLMNESHVSLRDDYDVTGVELDTLVKLALQQDGVIGSRMTGAGFGGCTISIVKEDLIDTFRQNVEKKYTEIIGYEPTFYIVNVGAGARKLK